MVKFFADAVIGTLSLTFSAKAAVTIYQGLSLIKGFKDVLTAVKLAFWNWQVALGLVAVAVAIAYAIYLY